MNQSENYLAMLSHPRTLSIANTLAYLLNTLETAGVGPFSSRFTSGQDNATISSKYQTIITPNGIAFSIWGLIFLMQLICVLVTWVSERKRSHPLMVEGVAWWYVGVCIAQTAWSPAFAYEKIPLSALFMGCILVTLMAIVVRQYRVVTDLLETQPEGGESSEALKRSDFWLLQFPFEIHLGWIAAAFALNLNIVVVASGAGANTQVAVSAVFLVILAMVSFACLFAGKRPIYTIPWVVVWATGWIVYELKNPQQSILETFSTDQINAVRKASSAVCGIIAFVTLFCFVFERLGFMPNKMKSKHSGENKALTENAR